MPADANRRILLFPGEPRFLTVLGGQMPVQRSIAELSLRLRVQHAPKGVTFAMQTRTSELVAPTRIDSDELVFDFSVRAEIGAGRKLRLLGRFVHGPPESRFLYVNSGTLAGQSESCWNRRAKVPLSAISAAMVEKVVKTGGARLEAGIFGRAGDGGPACASVPLIGSRWRVSRDYSKAR